MEIRFKNEDGNILELLNFEKISSTGSDNIIEADLRIYLGEIIINSQMSLMFSVLKKFLV